MTHRNCKTEQLAALAHEAQTVIKHARIDLQAFKALDEATKAARWRSMDRLAKFDLMCQRIAEQHDGEWFNDEVEFGIATYDARWGAEPLTSEAAVEGALERLAEENAQSARTARAAGLADDARFFQRAANSYVNALTYWRVGVRPTYLATGAWLLPSQRGPNEPSHLLRKDGDWVCTCQAGGYDHWAKAMIVALEIGAEDLNRFDDPVEPAPAPLRTAAQLGQRLARQRMQVYGKGVVGATIGM